MLEFAILSISRTIAVSHHLTPYPPSPAATRSIQLFIDAARGKDWSSIIGNPAKLYVSPSLYRLPHLFILTNVYLDFNSGLSVLSMLFTVIFIIQHYVLYTDHSDEHLDNIDHETRETRGRSVSLDRSVASVRGPKNGDVERGRRSELSPLLG